jgi:hypothetical protein
VKELEFDGNAPIRIRSGDSQDPPQQNIRVVRGFSRNVFGRRAKDFKAEASIEGPSDVIVEAGVNPMLC